MHHIPARRQGKTLAAKANFEAILKINKVVTLGTLDANSKIKQLTKDYPDVTFEILDKHTIKCTRNN